VFLVSLVSLWAEPNDPPNDRQSADAQTLVAEEYRGNLGHFLRRFPSSGGGAVPAEERLRLKRNLDKLGYPYWDETANPACRCFLSSDVVESNDQLPRTTS
jgi:hypothetical protein